MDIGNFRLSSLNAGSFWLDGGTMFGSVPKILWEKKNPCDEKNRICLAMRSLLIESKDKKILIDCGAGDKGNEKFRSLYCLSSCLEESLREKNLLVKDITHVILTHLHFDHVGGATFQSSKGNWEPTFPHATYFLQKKQWDQAQHPNVREKSSFFKESFEPLLKKQKLHLLEGPCMLFPGIEILVSDGHTPGQQIVKIFDSQKTLLFGGDVFPTSSHIHLPWIMSYDDYPLLIMEEKEKLLLEAVKGGWVLFYEHDPKIMASYVFREKNRFLKGENLPGSSFS